MSRGRRRQYESDADRQAAYRRRRRQMEETGAQVVETMAARIRRLAETLPVEIAGDLMDVAREMDQAPPPPIAPDQVERWAQDLDARRREMLALLVEILNGAGDDPAELDRIERSLRIHLDRLTRSQIGIL